MLSHLPMFNFVKNFSFATINIAYMTPTQPALITKSVVAVMELVTDVRLCLAQPTYVYSASDIQKAFRSLQSGKIQARWLSIWAKTPLFG